MTIATNNIQSLVADTPVVFKDLDGVREMGQLCTAWVNFNGSGTVAIRDSFNVSSITDNGTGDYTVNLTNALNNSNYCVTTSGGQQDGTPQNVFGATYSIATSVFKINFKDTGGLAQDVVFALASVFGGL